MNDQTETFSRTFRILESRLAEAQALFAQEMKIHARLAKKGYQMPPPTMTIGDTEVVAKGGDGLQVVVYRHITIQGQYPHIGGWKVVAVKDLLEGEEGGEVLIRTVPGEEVPPEVREHKGCDHCHTNRARKTEYVLKKRETA